MESSEGSPLISLSWLVSRGSTCRERGLSDTSGRRATLWTDRTLVHDVVLVTAVHAEIVHATMFLLL